MSEPLMIARSFAVDPRGVALEMTPEESVRHMGVSGAMSAAYDILDDAGLATEQRLSTCLAAERHGDDPEALARKLVRLYRTLNE